MGAHNKDHNHHLDDDNKVLHVKFQPHHKHEENTHFNKKLIDRSSSSDLIKYSAVESEEGVEFALTESSSWIRDAALIAKDRGGGGEGRGEENENRRQDGPGGGMGEVLGKGVFWDRKDDGGKLGGKN